MGNVIAVIAASGGVGASSLAAALAVRAAAAGRSCVAVDLDRLAGRLDVVLGAEQVAGWRWPDLAEVHGVVDGLGLADHLPTSFGVPVLAGGDGWGADPGPPWLEIVPDVVSGLVAAHEVTVLDVPRDAGVLAAVAALVDAVVVVIGTDVVQLGSATRAVPGVRRVVDAVRRPREAWADDPLAPIEPWAVLRGARVEPDLEDLVMDELDVPVVATVGDDRRLAGELADGLPPGARGRGDLVRAADRVLLRLVAQGAAA
jgi:hypothetical protein